MIKTNLEELKLVRTELVLGEIIEQTSRCALIWDKTGVNTWETRDDYLDYYLTNQGNSITLDIHKNLEYKKSYSSLLYPKVRDLYSTIYQISNIPNRRQKMLRVLESLTQPYGHRYWYFGNGGVLTSGLTVLNWQAGVQGGSRVSGGVSVGITPRTFGGMRSGGSAEYSYDWDSAVILGGEAENTEFMLVELESYGVLISGESFNIFDEEASTESGLFLGGESNISDDIDVQGGVFINGDSETQAIYDEYHYGGSVVDGHAAEQFDFTGEGTAILNGDSFNIFDIDLDLIASNCSGEATIDCVFEVVVEDSSLLTGGENESESAKFEIMDGGVLIDGDYTNLFEGDVEVSGVTLTNSEDVIEFAFYNEDSESYGVFVLPGSLEERVQFDDMYGGIILDGDPFNVFDEESIGGLTLAGGEDSFMILGDGPTEPSIDHSDMMLSGVADVDGGTSGNMMWHFPDGGLSASGGEDSFMILGDGPNEPVIERSDMMLGGIADVDGGTSGNMMWHFPDGGLSASGQADENVTTDGN